MGFPVVNQEALFQQGSYERLHIRNRLPLGDLELPNHVVTDRGWGVAVSEKLPDAGAYAVQAIILAKVQIKQYRFVFNDSTEDASAQTITPVYFMDLLVHLEPSDAIAHRPAGPADGYELTDSTQTIGRVGISRVEQRWAESRECKV
jgi:hypothetical protein